MEYNHPDLKYWLALNKFGKFGPVRFKRLRESFNNPKSIFEASLNELINAKIETKVAEEFIAYKQRIEPDKLLEVLDKSNSIALLSFEKDYPEKLSKIFNPPFIIYIRGKLTNSSEKLAVVGTRKFSQYGKQLVEDLVPPLASAGLGIVSGLALGIDALAHQATLSTGGYTIAVLGSGVDDQSIYPAANRYLAKKIIDSGGCLVSEFPPETPALKHHFPLRNRIISGLSFGVLVIEAAEQSGSLITAQIALEQNREIFSVPGSIYSPLSNGTNKLIKQGAIPVTSPDDILNTLDLSITTSYSSKKYLPETAEEKLILSFISKEAIHVNELARKTLLPINNLNSALAILEIKGAIKNLGGMNYITN